MKYSQKKKPKKKKLQVGGKKDRGSEVGASTGRSKAPTEYRVREAHLAETIHRAICFFGGRGEEGKRRGEHRKDDSPGGGARASSRRLDGAEGELSGPDGSHFFFVF